MGPPPQGLCFCAPWAWGIGERSMPNIWWIDMMEKLEGAEEGENGGAGLRFSLRLDPRKPGFDRTLLSLPVSALFSHLLGWNKNSQRRSQGSMVITEEGGQSAAAVAVAAAAAVAIYLAAMYASDQQPRRPRRRRLSASALPRPKSTAAARPRALPAPDDGLRILSSNDESLENVIHGTSIGAVDDEPVLVARVETKSTDMAGGNADGETEHGQSEKEQEEVELLKELWLSLLEREQRLELRLMELDGLREQEATVRDLENRVCVAAVEARLMELKVSSLQEENERLNAQVSELDAARAKLARAKEKLRELKARVQSEQEEARREAAALRERVMELEKNGEVRARALAEEAAALRKANAGLEEENLELALSLQDAEKVASSVNLVLEDDFVEEASYLRETNERLTRQIEQLHSDHCAHVEELVYLKWVNACLRHDLRNHEHHPSSGEQDQDAGGLSAMDLSKSMSYRSSEKAKQLMLQYGNLSLDGFDPGLFSPLHESLYGDGDGDGDGGGGDYDDEKTRVRKDETERSPSMSTTMAAATAPTKRARPSKLKFLKNIKNLIASSKRGHSHGRESKKAPIDEHLEKAMRWLSSHDELDGDNSYESTPLSSCERTPLSSVTTVDSHAPACGGEAAEAAASRLEAETARSKSDIGESYGREASRYHALRPDHPAGVGPDGFHAPEKRELRRHSEELRNPEAVHVRPS